jgi:hypothetical protein
MKLFALRKSTRKPLLPLLLGLAFFGCSETVPNESQNEGGAPPTGSPTDSHSAIPRSDTPEYGVRGPHFVGFHTYSEAAPHRPNGIHFKVWYPTDTTGSDLLSIEYPISFKNPEWENFKPALVYGYALEDAPLAESEPAFPVVVFSHGYSLFAEINSERVDQFA